MRERDKRVIRNIFCIVIGSILILPLLSTQLDADETEKDIWLLSETISGSSFSSLRFIQNFIYRIMFINNVISNDLIKFVDIIYKDFEYNLLKNPDVRSDGIRPLITYFVKILAPLYTAAMLSVGIYLVFISGSPYERAKAKFYLLKLLVGMIFISLSINIIELLLSLSSGLTLVILSLGPTDVVDMHRASVFYFIKKMQILMLSDISFGIIPLLFSIFLAVSAFMILIARYFLIILFSVTLPLAIFLLSFSLTRRIGKFFIQQLIYWVFLQVIFAITIVAIAFGESSIHWAMPELRDFYISGTLVLIFIPIGALYFGIKYGTKSAGRILNYLPKFEQTLIPELKERLSEKEIEEQLKELSDRKRRIALERLKQRRELYRELEEEAKKKEMSMQEYIAEWYGMKVIEKKEPYVVEYPKTITITPATEAKRPSLRELSKAEKEIIVKLGLKVKPAQVAVSVERDNSTKLTLNVENLTPLVLHSINFIEQDLVEEDILVDYSEKKFDLKPGEVKAIKVKITVMEDAKIKTYEGTIFVTCREGFKNFVDIKVDVKPKETEPLLKDLADEYGEVSYETLKEENLELYEQLKKEAAEQGKTLEEYATEKYGIKIVGIPKEEKGIEREKVTTEMRAIKAEVERVKGKKEVRQLKGEVTEELSEEEKVKIEKEEKFILAPLAQKAKPKIVKIENF